ncbi:MAG: C45 family autoproteolytic acyltransferase/hydrolase, partial [Verrucomicrobiaceae bacterium]
MKASTSSSVLAAMMFGWLPTVVPGADFQPDPVAVQRFGPGYRYPQAGWIVIHIQGDAYERGVQHGRLLALEIAAYVKCLALLTNPKAPEDSWKVTRSMCNALFLRGFTAEQLQEMKGIADGAAAAGARHEGHPVDLLDILAINTFTEYESLDKALDVTPSSLAGRPDAAAKAAQKSSLKMQEQPKPSHCISFAATAPVTKDGKVVFGHITMFDAYPARFFNVWLDLQPNAGHRFVMQTYPGGIHSGMDYVISDAGLMLGETNISQTSFDIKGVPLASRIRQAIQYAGSISDAAEILGSNGNGLAATEWVLADAGKNETALFTLGTRAKQLHLSSRNDWLAGTDGFYWSCNNSKDLEHRLETLESLHGRPSPIGIFNPTTRDAIWLRRFERGKGTSGEDCARDVLTNPSLVSAASVDAKYTTSDLARELKSWATFGPPVGSKTVPDPRAFKDRPDARTMV